MTLLVTYSGITDPEVEPLDSQIAVDSLKMAYQHARTYGVVLYWRPLIVGVNDSDQHVERAIELSRDAHATVFTGLFFREEIREHYQSLGIPEPYEISARRKILPESIDIRVTRAFRKAEVRTLFRKTSCAVAFAHRTHDWNGHYGIQELCGICPVAQVGRCHANWRKPKEQQVRALMHVLDSEQTLVIHDRAIEFPDMREEERYYIQHSLGFQVHSRQHPHQPHRHGRADIGWE